MILVIGKTGQLARALAEVLPPDAEPTFLGRDQLDLTDPARAEEIVAASGASLVINAAAYTGVDAAETDRETAALVNAAAPGALARGAASCGAAFAHVSTDYVFDGTRPGARIETDAPSPLGVYGETKLAGENAALAGNPRTLILRTSWVYSPFGRNFVKTMLGLAEREELRVVMDQRGAPTSALDLAAALAEIAPRLEEAAAGAPAWGIFHYCGQGVTTWAEFAETIFAQARAKGMIARAPKVAHIPSSEYPTPARRPANSALDCAKFDAVFGATRPDWRESLARVLDRLNEEGAP